MSDWLVIQLIAPLASFGELAGNTRRGSRERPGRGMLLGLLGAALGVKREDAEGQRALFDGYEVASCTLKPGRILQDYHSIQSLPHPKRAGTRAQALAQRDALVTSLTLREYRQDVAFEAAYAARSGARWDLASLREALLSPRFTLYLGRKSCPLAAPLAPRIVSADGPLEAFEAARSARREDWLERDAALRGKPGPRRGLGAGEGATMLALTARSVAVESEHRARYHNRPLQQQRRRDDPTDRGGWHFADREEIVIDLPNQENPPNHEKETGR
ncbi:MAG: type I-E CRISPR-associated protein Cas5/CasD [Neomegalonema sp.]|nr:type I-E CRISPR-associated protein Cas5/CasD [Neomegalonema sp.]